MRGVSSEPPCRVLAARSLSSLEMLLFVCALSSSAIFSGCAAVNGGSSPAAAQISVVPSVVNFSAVVVGQKNSQSLKISNVSTNSVALDPVKVSGSVFSVSSSTSPILLAPGKSTTVTVVFAPSAAAADTGALIISSPDFKNPLDVPLSGTGEKAAPALQVSPATLSFGPHAANTSTAESAALKNSGNVALKIDSVTISNPSFTITGLSTGVSLAVGQQLNFQVWFHPTSTGTWSASLSVASSSLSAPVKLSLAGSSTNSSTTGSGPPSAHSVTLNWVASTSQVAGYHIYRGQVSGGPYSRIDGSLVNSLSFSDSSVLAGAHYFYVVTAVEYNGAESAYSNEAASDIPNCLR